MAKQNINMAVGCEECRFADRWGRGGKHGLMRPIILTMSGQRCELKKPKTAEQLQEQLEK